MKCVVLLLAVCAFEMISTSPVRSGGMVFYQPDYYNAHRAFVMQYASQPIRTYKSRQGQAAVVSSYASGKQIRTGTLLKQSDFEQPEEPKPQYLPGGAQSIAEAYPENEEHEEESLNDEEDEQPQQPHIANDVPVEEVQESHQVAIAPPKKAPPQHDEIENDAEDDEEEEEQIAPVRTKSRTPSGATYFPVSFGNTNGGAIAIANSYSTGGTASSRATAYGSPAKSSTNNKKNKKQ